MLRTFREACISIALIFSCAACTETNYFDDPYLNAIWEQQAPFGIDTVEVKLKSVDLNGELRATFHYDRGFLSEIRQFHTFDSLRLVGTMTSHRITSEIQSVIARQPQVIDWDKNYVSDAWIDKGQTTFKKPTSDSIRVVEHEMYVNSTRATATYFFNKHRKISKMNWDTPVTPTDSYLETYERNGLMNIVKAVRTGKANPTPTVTVMEYDSHPNPFFQSGFDHEGNISYHSLSPNNIVKMQFTDAQGQKHSDTFSYKYLPNGYPERVEIKKVINGNENAGVRTVMAFQY